MGLSHHGHQARNTVKLELRFFVWLLEICSCAYPNMCVTVWALLCAYEYTAWNREILVRPSLSSSCQLKVGQQTDTVHCKLIGPEFAPSEQSAVTDRRAAQSWVITQVRQVRSTSLSWEIRTKQETSLSQYEITDTFISVGVLGIHATREAKSLDKAAKRHNIL